MTENTSLFDLIIACCRGIRNLFVAMWLFLCKCVRLTWRKWYIVLPMLAIGIGLGWCCSNLRYKIWQVEAVAIVNCGSAELVINRYEQLNNAFPAGELPSQAPAAMLDWGENPGEAYAVSRFKTFRVIDCLNDSLPDYIDYKHKNTLDDTLHVAMQDRLCLRFWTRHLPSLPKAEKAIVDYLNNDPQIQAAYQAHLANLKWEADFCDRQVNLLDSFTYEFYFHQGVQTAAAYDRWEMLVGKRDIELFHNEILQLVEHKKKVDRELSLATAPVVIESRFTASPRAVNRRSVMLLLGASLAWVLGLLLAACVEQRKKILVWMRK